RGGVVALRATKGKREAASEREQLMGMQGERQSSTSALCVGRQRSDEDVVQAGCLVPLKQGQPVSSLGVAGEREDPYLVHDGLDETGWLASLPYYDDYAGSYEDEIRGTAPTPRPFDVGIR
ncbi:hypothetical protein FOZ62_026552, partial [Perkinsus olseni]